MMNELELVIGNRNYSSWSLRAYMALAAAELDFEVKMVPLDQPETAAALAAHSPTAKVPVLRIRTGDGSVAAVWESIAIAEWAAERCPRLWPSETTARAFARSVSAEMHAGFVGLRSDMPMNCRGQHPGVGHSSRARRDIKRVELLWQQCRERFGSSGSYLFGEHLTVADAMFAPVVSRFVTYGVSLGTVASGYIETMMAAPAMVTWLADAAIEPWSIAIAEPDDPAWQGGPRKVD